MNSRLLSFDKFQKILSNKIKKTQKLYQSDVCFYKLSQKHIDFIKSEININIDTDIIVKKQYKYAGGAGTIKMGGKVGQYNREKNALLKLQNESHFPTILCADDESTTIYMTYCGNTINKTDIPINWKKQMREILSTLQKYKIYNNDAFLQNFLIKDGIIFLIDFGWASFDKEDFPYINITEKDVDKYDDLFKLSKIVFEREKTRTIQFENMCRKPMNFITGEKIQFLCDHFIGDEKNFKFNPNIYKLKNKLIDIHKLDKFIDNKKNVFCYNTTFYNVDLIVKKLKYMKNPFNLIFHNSDLVFNQKHLILFEKIPLLLCIFTQNMNVNHEKVFPLPIGLGNSQWTHGNSKIHQQVYEMRVEKTKEIYFNFSKVTNPQKRNKCYDDIIKKGIKWNNNKPYKEYLIELKRHKYAICPEGNGIDTHRFWECLYMNTIPICLKNNITQYYKNLFPMVLLDKWSELSVSNILSSYKELYKKFNGSNEYLDMTFLLKKLNSEQ